MPYKDPEKQKQYWVEYRKKHKEHRAVLMRQWIDKNKDKYDQWQADYRAKNRKARAEKSMECRLKKPDIYREKNRIWRKNNPQWRKDNYIKNREHFLELQKLSYLRNREKRIKDVKEYAKKNPHIRVKIVAIRRLRIEATIENESAIADFIRLVRNSKWVYCYYCDRRVSGKKAHIDHMVPLSRGGKHSPDNLCASCAPCNLTKHSKLISEWERQGQQILSL